MESKHGIAITFNKPNKGTVYPVTPDQVKEELDSMDSHSVHGLKEVVFKNPDAPGQDKAWAQFTRSDGKINIFPQKVGPDGKIDGMDVKQVNNHMTEYVLPHEVAHNYLWNVVKHRDDPEEIEEAKAWAITKNQDYEDHNVIHNQVQRLRNGQV
jgi:hypothetical protein